MTSLLTLIAVAGVALSPLQRAVDVRDSVAMNVHIEYTDGGYHDLARVMDCLNYIGVREVRDAAPNPSNQGQAGYAALAKAGIKFDVFINGEPIAPALKRLDALARAAPGALASIEGPNEINNHSGFSFEGDTEPHRAGRAYQAALFAGVKADPVLRDIPVLEFTDYPFTSARADVANEHVYPPGGNAPGEQVVKVATDASARVPSRRVVFTELGFSSSSGNGDVSALAQSRLLLASLLEAASAGVRRSYVYQLLDAYPDPAGADHEKHFGVFDINYAPKPAAHMLREVAKLLEDRSPQARSFAPAAVHLDVLSPASDVRSLTLQKATGEQIVAIWRRTPVYDTHAHRDLEVAAVPVDLRLADAHGDIIVNDPVASTQGRLSAKSPLVRVLVGADPVLLTIGPRASPAS